MMPGRVPVPLKSRSLDARSPAAPPPLDRHYSRSSSDLHQVPSTTIGRGVKADVGWADRHKLRPSTRDEVVRDD